MTETHPLPPAAATARLANWPTALLGATLLWVSMEPLGWWPAGWVALTPWAWLALQRDPLPRSTYRTLWLASSGMWLVALYGLCFAHPAMFLGWLTLSLYLGVYAPLFVGLVRVAGAHRVPAVIAVPVVWVGLECIRGYAFTGFSAGLLGHSQAELPQVIQIADAFGSYGVSFVLATVSVAIAVAIRRLSVPQSSDSLRPVWVSVAVAVAAVAVMMLYGNWRLSQREAVEGATLGKTIALIQRNEKVQYLMTPEREAEIFDSYFAGSQAAMRDAGSQPVDLVVWPESMFTRGLPWMVMGENATVPDEAEMEADQFRNLVLQRTEVFQQNAAEMQRRLAMANGQIEPPALLLGSAVMQFRERTHHYSGAVFVSPGGRVVDWYGKRHLVMFGEYIPFAEWVPAVFGWLPLPRCTPGAESKTFVLSDTAIAPNICFETAVECGTINQVRELKVREQRPDVLINLTNDAWFGGSPILDHHRRCSQFAAVSTRTPLLMTSNTGPTFWADGSGRIQAALEKNADGHLLATPTRDGRWGVYQAVKDWPARVCGAFVVVLGILGQFRRRNDQKKGSGGVQSSIDSRDARSMPTTEVAEEF